MTNRTLTNRLATSMIVVTTAITTLACPRPLPPIDEDEERRGDDQLTPPIEDDDDEAERDPSLFVDEPPPVYADLDPSDPDVAGGGVGRHDIDGGACDPSIDFARCRGGVIAEGCDAQTRRWFGVDCRAVDMSAACDIVHHVDEDTFEEFDFSICVAPRGAKCWEPRTYSGTSCRAADGDGCRFNADADRYQCDSDAPSCDLVDTVQCLGTEFVHACNDTDSNGENGRSWSIDCADIGAACTPNVGCVLPPASGCVPNATRCDAGAGAEAIACDDTGICPTN